MFKEKFSLVLAVFIILPAAAFSQNKDFAGTPTKIEVTSEPLSPVQGQNVKIHVKLLDPENHAAVANKDFEVNIEGHSRTGASEKATVLIKAGQTEKTIELPAKNSGIVEVIASNRELAEGGTVVNVRASSQRERASMATPAPAPSAAPPAADVPAERVPSAPTTTTTAARHMRSLARAAAPETTPSSVTRLAAATAMAPPPPAASVAAAPAPVANAVAPTAWTPKLAFLYYPKRALRADSKDAATVCAYLPASEPAQADLSIYLMSDLGPLTPAPIKIPRGEIQGTATLVADRPAAVQVWYQYSTPTANAPDPPLMIKFCPPVWGLKVVPGSPKIGLFESAQVGVEPVDSHGTTIPADERREVYWRLESGAGELGNAPAALDPGISHIEAKFTPNWPGVVKVVATSPFLQEASASFTVAPPVSLLLFCALGGLLGGLLAYLVERPNASWSRILIGLVTGFVLYWGVLFGPIPLPNVSHSYLLNPFTVTVVAIVGGWIGTKVFTLLLKLFKLEL